MTHSGVDVEVSGSRVPFTAKDVPYAERAGTPPFVPIGGADEVVYQVLSKRGIVIRWNDLWVLTLHGQYILDVWYERRALAHELEVARNENAT